LPPLLSFRRHPKVTKLKFRSASNFAIKIGRGIDRLRKGRTGVVVNAPEVLVPVI